MSAAGSVPRRIAIVTGMIATYPVGGVVWDYGQYALGLERMGFDVYYLEDTGLATYDPTGRIYVEDPAYGIDFLGRSLAFLSESLGRRWHFRAPSGRTYGMDPGSFDRVLADADLFLNVSGGTVLREAYAGCRCKIFIDTDPGRNHFWNFPRLDADPTWDGGIGYRHHDHFFTYAERIGRSDCALPILGIDWHPTRPPVVLDRWFPEPPGERWTTVMSWSGRAQANPYEDIRYGAKEMEFERIETLPKLVPVTMEIAVGGTDRPRDEKEAVGWHDPRPRWEALGWSVLDARGVSANAESYRSYVQRSRGEFSVAKNVYVATRSGWFSCRSVCYLAASRPVVVQDTGFAELIPSGEGLVAFSSLEEAAEGLRRVEADYERHQAMARRIADEHFSSDRVLHDMLITAGAD